MICLAGFVDGMWVGTQIESRDNMPEVRLGFPWLHGVPENLPTENPPKNTEQKHKSLRCKIAWSFFSRKPPALTSISRRKSAIHPAIASINVCQRYPPCCALWGFSMGYDNPLPLLCAFPPWRACEVEVRYPPPPQKGYPCNTCAIPYENKAKACDTPLCDTISRGYCSEGTITRVSCNPTFAQRKRRVLSGGFLLILLCVSGRKGPSKDLRETLVTSDTRVSLVKVLPKLRDHMGG